MALFQINVQRGTQTQCYSCRLIFSGLVIYLHSHILVPESNPIFQRSYSILSDSVAMTKNEDADLDS